MNPRIHELALQATEKYTTYFDGRGNVTETYFDKEKFAELIIRECAKLADEPTSHPFQSYDVMIKEHFGIK